MSDELTMYSTQWWAAVAAGGLLLLVLLTVLALRILRRRRAARAQAAAQAAYDADVETFRETTTTAQQRRAELVHLLEHAVSPDQTLALSAEPEDAKDPSLARFYVDLAAARHDKPRRDVLVGNLTQAIVGVEMLLPEAPAPRPPVPGLSRRERARAEAWYAERAAELPMLQSLTVPSAATVLMPKQRQRRPQPAAAAEAPQTSTSA